MHNSLQSFEHFCISYLVTFQAQILEGIDDRYLMCTTPHSRFETLQVFLRKSDNLHAVLLESPNESHMYYFFVF